MGRSEADRLHHEVVLLEYLSGNTNVLPEAYFCVSFSVLVHVWQGWVVTKLSVLVKRLGRDHKCMVGDREIE